MFSFCLFQGGGQAERGESVLILIDPPLHLLSLSAPSTLFSLTTLACLLLSHTLSHSLSLSHAPPTLAPLGGRGSGGRPALTGRAPALPPSVPRPVRAARVFCLSRTVSTVW